MNIPPVITESRLYNHLHGDQDLLTAILSLRSVTENLANTVSRTVPSFTDHSIRHMDALWRITDHVLSTDEIIKLTMGEAFLLASGFYLHDIGMAYAATSEGLARCRTSDAYASYIASIPENRRGDSEIEAQAIALAIRKLHANAAIELATSPVPGTDIYLFESHIVRNEWGETCGKIAASHHWNIEQVEQDLGKNGTIPLPRGRKGDLGYVAAVLRIVDYAHINRERASLQERLFRQPLTPDSLIHWLAQENIDGPEREINDLVYRASQPIKNVDAWWLYYEIMTGLDAEIRAVHRYLDRRTSSHGRFSLQTVRGSTSPQEAASYIPPDGFLPIEVNLRTGSIDRLVQLLAGESLYGPDPMAAVRELLQNARDAVMLKASIASSEADKALLSLPIKLMIHANENGHTFEIQDWGTGMTPKVMTDYLISIASDYWSSQFNIDFPNAAKSGFQPAGKFGIGFLSVFMLGDEITVESNRVGGERTRLVLHGVGRRGELRTVSPESGSGTAIRIQLKESVLKKLHNLPNLVRIYAPMLSHSLEVAVEDQVTEIKPRWIFEMPAQDFHTWILKAIQTLRQNRHDQSIEETIFLRRLGIEKEKDVQKIWPLDWPEFADSNTRLLTSFAGTSLVCLKGLAVQAIRTPGFTGVVNLELLTTDVSRQKVLQVDLKEVLARAKSEVHTQIVNNLNILANNGLIINKLHFLYQCVSTYGREVLRDSSISWISLIKFPGEVELHSSGAFVDKLKDSGSLFIAFNTGPWTAMKKWEASNPLQKGNELALVLDGQGSTPGYQSGDDEVIGSLLEIWPECTQSALFSEILQLTCDAWQVGLENLTSQSDWHHLGTTIWGRLTRP